MRVLIIGGTVFLGRHVVDAAVEAGHHVTLFHRGRHPSHRPHDVREVHGDRGRGLEGLAGERFDVVVDTCAYHAAHVHAAVEALRGFDHYTLVSSGSVYADLSGPVDESTALHEAQLEERPGPDEGGYGPLKVACEQEARRKVGRSRLLVQRAGVIVGPHDVAQRFTYWARRFRERDEVLVPDCRAQPLQYIDVRDMAAWTVLAFEQGVVGTMNVVGPRGQHTFGDLLDACIEAVDDGGDATYAKEDFLLDHDVAPWSDLPMWLPARLGMGGLLQMDASLCLQAGLVPRPLATTARDSLVDLSEPAVPIDFGTRAAGAGLSEEREDELLAMWHRQSALTKSRPAN